MRSLLILTALLAISLFMTGCATITNDPMTPIAVSLSTGEEGDCTFQNKRGLWQAHVPCTVSIRRSDDVLKYDCETKDGGKAT